MKAFHKPDAVDFVYWNDDDNSRRQLADLGYRRDNGDFEYANPDAPEGTRTLLVPTSEGRDPRGALPGEYVVLHHHVAGWWPVPVTVFRSRYNIADEAQAVS